MTKTIRPILYTVAGSALLAVTPHIAFAQGRARSRPDPVPLTEANLARYAKASDNLAGYIRQHPGEADLSGGDKSYDSVDEAAKDLCEPHPGVRQAIDAGGMTCTEYLGFTMALERTAGLAAMAKDGPQPTPGLGASATDIAFYRKHEPEVKRVLREIGAGAETE
jgi:hypothetical protein